MAERLSNDLLRIWQSGEFSDVTLVCSDGGRVEAHKQILKYQRTITGNRGLILKIFGVLLFFIVVFGTMRR